MIKFAGVRHIDVRKFTGQRRSQKRWQRCVFGQNRRRDQASQQEGELRVKAAKRFTLRRPKGSPQGGQKVHPKAAERVAPRRPKGSPQGGQK
eukprot:2294460-Pleurochrysis_carterae.AAC.2